MYQADLKITSNKLERIIVEYLGIEINLLLKKYGQESELSQKLSKVSLDPLVYLEMDSKLMKLDETKNKKFYKEIVGKVLDALRPTPVVESEGFRRIDSMYSSDFPSLFWDYDHPTSPIKPHHVGANLQNLLREITPDRSAWPYFIINILTVPSLPYDEVTIKGRRVVDNEGASLNKRGIKYALYLHGAISTMSGVRRALVSPGWILDGLQDRNYNDNSIHTWIQKNSPWEWSQLYHNLSKLRPIRID